MSNNLEEEKLFLNRSCFPPYRPEVVVAAVATRSHSKSSTPPAILATLGTSSWLALQFKSSFAYAMTRARSSKTSQASISSPHAVPFSI